MKKYTLIALMALFCAPVINKLHAQTWKWATGSRCPGSLFESAPVAVDRMGNVYSSGELIPASLIPWDSVKCYYGSDSTTGAGMILVSTDSNGVYRWAQRYNHGQAAGIATDANNNLYVFGYFPNDMTMGSFTLTAPSSPNAFCAKLNSAGTVLWLKKIADSAYCISGGADMFGNVYVAGELLGSTAAIGSTTLTNASSPGDYDTYLAKLDTGGNPVWAKSFGGDSMETLVAIGVSDSGNTYLAGTYKSTSFSVGSDLLTFPAGSGKPYYYLAKYNAAGDPQWGRSAVTKGGNFLNGMAIDHSENAYLIGGYTNNIIFGDDSLPDNSTLYQHMFLARYDKLGNARWASSVDNMRYAQAWAVAPDACGNIWVAGAETVMPGDPMYIFRFDTAGAFADSMFLASGGEDQIGLAVDNRGHLYVGGDYEIDSFIVDTDTLRLTAGSLETLFLAKYSYPICTIPTLEIQRTISVADVNIYPNPATDQLKIETGRGAYHTFVITNAMGQVFMQGQITGAQTEVTIKSLPAGLYYVSLKGAKGLDTRKFVKM